MPNRNSTNPQAEEEEEMNFEMEITHPAIGKIYLSLKQALADKLFDSIKKLFPWLLSALIGGTFGMKVIPTIIPTQTPPDQTIQPQIK